MPDSLSLLFAAAGTIGAIFGVRKLQWEGRMVACLIVLAFVETGAVALWLGVGHQWSVEGDSWAWVEWLGVWAGFTLLNEGGYWFMRSELRRSLEDLRRSVADEARAIRENRDVAINNAKQIADAAHAAAGTLQARSNRVDAMNNVLSSFMQHVQQMRTRAAAGQPVDWVVEIDRIHSDCDAAAARIRNTP